MCCCTGQGCTGREGCRRKSSRDGPADLRRYNADGIAGLSNRHSPGRLPRLTEGQKAVLKLVLPAILHPAFVHARDPEGGLEGLSAR